MVQEQADRLGVPVSIEKVTDYPTIAGYGIAATPGVVVDGRLVHAGGLPKPDSVAQWLAARGGSERSRPTGPSAVSTPGRRNVA
jgi:hypothetical protein